MPYFVVVNIGKDKILIKQYSDEQQVEAEDRYDKIEEFVGPKPKDFKGVALIKGDILESTGGIQFGS